MPRQSRLQPLARAVLRTQTDDRLVALARDGKEAAFEEIVRRYRPGLVAFAAAYGPPDPEDVVQESLVRSWDALRDSTGEMHLKAWLYTIVRNRALNARRDTRVHEPLTNEIDGVPQPPEIVLTNDELRRAVVAVGALPVAQREALVRSALEGHTHDQIAAAMGSTPGAVRQLIYRGRMTLRHGVGAVIPLPLVAALAELGIGGAGVTAGAAAGGAAAAGAAGGGSLVAKAAVIAAVGALAAGSGVAIKRAADDHGKVGADVTQAAAEPDRSKTANTASGTGSGEVVGVSNSSAGGDDASQASASHASGTSGSGEQSGSSSGQGPTEQGGGAGDGDSGTGGGGASGGDPGPEPSDEVNDDDGSSSGPGGPDDGDRSSSGPGGPGSSDDGGPEPGDDGSDSSGPGSGDELPEPPEGEPPDDNSGPGSGDEPPELH